jgi:hypothetical protein
MLLGFVPPSHAKAFGGFPQPRRTAHITKKEKQDQLMAGRLGLFLTTSSFFMTNWLDERFLRKHAMIKAWPLRNCI